MTSFTYIYHSSAAIFGVLLLLYISKLLTRFKEGSVMWSILTCHFDFSYISPTCRGFHLTFLQICSWQIIWCVFRLCLDYINLSVLHYWRIRLTVLLLIIPTATFILCFFSQTCHLWNAHRIRCFPGTYISERFTRNVNRQI